MVSDFDGEVLLSLIVHYAISTIAVFISSTRDKRLQNRKAILYCGFISEILVAFRKWHLLQIAYWRVPVVSKTKEDLAIEKIYFQMKRELRRTVILIDLGQ